MVQLLTLNTMNIRIYIVLYQSENTFTCINTEATCGQLTSKIVMRVF